MQLIQLIKWLFINNKNNIPNLNKKFIWEIVLEFREDNNGSLLNKIKFLPNNYYKITEFINVCWWDISEKIYEYKIESWSIFSRAISIKKWWEFKIKDNTVLLSDIKKEFKNNEFKKGLEEETSLLKKECTWHKEDDCYIKSTLHILILKQSLQHMKNILREELEKYKLIKFELDELLEKKLIKYEYNKKKEIYEFIPINNNTIKEKDITDIWKTIKDKYWIDPSTLNFKIERINNCIEKFLANKKLTD